MISCWELFLVLATGRSLPFGSSRVSDLIFVVCAMAKATIVTEATNFVPSHAKTRNAPDSVYVGWKTEAGNLHRTAVL